jgi:hypothetical protein
VTKKPLVYSQLISRIFHYVHVDDLVGLIEQAAAIGTEVLEVDLLAYFEVAFGHLVEGFDGRHIHHPAFGKVDNDFVGVVEDVEFFVKNGA